MKNNLLYSAWHYKISIGYRVAGKVYYEDFDVITRKNYSGIHEQFPKFIIRDLKRFFHGFDVDIVSAAISDLDALNW